MHVQSKCTLSQFIKCIGVFPYISVRHTYRFADYFLNMHESHMEDFLKEIIKLRKSLTNCISCNSWRESSGECSWCGSHRNQSRMCVVETWIDAYVIERSGLFDGIYHVLGGALAPLDGMTPDVLSFNLCIQRALNGSLAELIIATNQTPEGEATASHLLRLLQHNGAMKNGLSVSCLASGVPVGSALEYVDKLTLGKALAHRRQVVQ